MTAKGLYDAQPSVLFLPRPTPPCSKQTSLLFACQQSTNKRAVELLHV